MFFSGHSLKCTFSKFVLDDLWWPWPDFCTSCYRTEPCFAQSQNPERLNHYLLLLWKLQCIVWELYSFVLITSIIYALSELHSNFYIPLLTRNKSTISTKSGTQPWHCVSILVSLFVGITSWESQCHLADQLWNSVNKCQDFKFLNCLYSISYSIPGIDC